MTRRNSNKSKKVNRPRDWSDKFVYFARGHRSKLIKIGCSNSPDFRTATFKYKFDQGESATVLFAIPGAYKEETDFHKQFKKHHSHGEWFYEEGELATFVKAGRIRYKKWRERPRPTPIPKSLEPASHAPDFSKVPPVPYVFGYARVSTAEQSLDMQITALNAAGCNRIFTDKLSGKTAHRLEFKRMMKHLQPGDTIIVYSLSRLFRNTKHLLGLFDDFKAQKITLRSLTEPLDLKTSYGRMAATMLAAVDEAEVGRVRERTIAGMAERGRQGVVFGRPAKVSPSDAAQMKQMRFKTKIPVPAIAQKFGVSQAAVYQHTKQPQA